MTLQWRNLEVLNEFAESPNSKLILTDGQTPVLLSTEVEE